MSLPLHTVRFGAFRLDLRAGELQHDGTRTKLPEQLFQILCELVEHPGEVVTREELRQRLWPSDAFVDFEHGLNTAVMRLREALGDSAERPRYVETLPRHGYRLIVPVEKPEPLTPEASNRRRKIWLTVAALMVVAVAAGVVWRQRRLDRFHPVKIESLAVLPLENLSGNPEEEYFADGITEALITELGKVHALRLISWQSVKQFKGTNKPVSQIARELRVDAVVEGSATRVGDNVRITTQLVQAIPERNLWSESYQRDLRDVLALQGDVARAITGEIRIRLTPLEQARLAAPRPVNPEAYQAYLKGDYYLEKRTGDDIRRAIASFQHAIDVDPDYALGYAGLARAYMYGSGGYGVLTSEEFFSKAEAAINKALERDETLGDPHSVLAVIRYQRDFDRGAAEREFHHALELEPGNAVVHYEFGIRYLVPEGRFDEGIAEIKRALELAPLSLIVNANLGHALTLRDLFRGGNYDEAIEQLQKTLALDSRFAVARFNLGYAYQLKGMYQEATTEFSGCAAAGIAVCFPQLGVIYSLTGRRTEALKVLEQMRKEYSKQSIEAYYFWLLYAALGDRSRAFVWLEKSYQQRDFNLLFVRSCTVDPACKQLSSDPRFQDLVSRMNFPLTN